MEYAPIGEDKKKEWIDWLESIRDQIDSLEENKQDKTYLNTPDGDAASLKDIVGSFLATLKNEIITIK